MVLSPAFGGPSGNLGPKGTAPVAISLDGVFRDHAVLQRDEPVRIWGSANPGEVLTIRFHNQVVGAVANKRGRWRAVLAPMAASSDSEDLLVSGHEVLAIHDVVIGDVWFCSGQSNMEFTVDEGMNAEREIAAARFPLIRQVVVGHAVSGAPSVSVATEGWHPASPAFAGKFTAVGYYFARDVFRAVHVPIGIVRCAWGGTPIEAWMSRKARAATPYSADIDGRWAAAEGEWTPARFTKYYADLKLWEDADANSSETHTRSAVPWPHPPATDTSPERPGNLYNGMVAPLRGLSIAGFVWYQGESNVDHPEEYAGLFKEMIRSWRAEWGMGNIPFYFVQLANFGDVGERRDRGWARLREAQEKALGLPATGMALAVDIGEADNVHPKNKQELGRRLALVAKAKYYRLSEKCDGPRFFAAAREGRGLRVSFSGVESELGSRDGPVASLEVAGPDHVFHAAEGVIDVDTLVVSSADVADPVAVRYAWTNAPVANLYDGDGLPMAPFRSDDW
ncbi:MAG TPA: sialate O-acetylesterase [Opitutaceae bacterium]